MEKRLILAIAMSILIIVSFQYLVGKPKFTPPAQPPVTVNAPPSVEPAAISPEAQESPLEEKETVIGTDKYILTFSNIGGALKDIKLKDYKDTKSSGMLGLVTLRNPKEYIFATSGRIGSAVVGSNEYEFSQTKDAATYSFKAGGIEVVKKYIIHNSKYGIELQLFIKNTSGQPKDVSYDIIGCAGLSEPSEQDKRFVEVISKTGDKINGFKRPKEGRITNPGQVSWVALKNKYFSIILKPMVDTNDAFYSNGKSGYLVAGAAPKAVIVPSNSFVENRFLLYAGPTQVSLLKDVNPEFGETINYGFLGGIAVAIMALLRFFFWLVHNWGFSVILLSVFLNIILFPLSMKSFKSMQKMQELHPQMEKLKKECKDNPQKLNKEMMELYKKYKINPFSGCLPLLLQMPIFFALYQALSRSIELRGAQYLWIKDLSMPDAVGLPVALPIFGSTINILPILMAVGMVVQQKISTKVMGGAVTDEQKQQQKMMLIMMPIIFGFVFYNMPSGLVLYWLVNTVLTIVEQAAIFKKT